MRCGGGAPYKRKIKDKSDRIGSRVGIHDPCNGRRVGGTVVFGHRFCGVIVLVVFLFACRLPCVCLLAARACRRRAVWLMRLRL